MDVGTGEGEVVTLTMLLSKVDGRRGVAVSWAQLVGAAVSSGWVVGTMIVSEEGLGVQAGSDEVVDVETDDVELMDGVGAGGGNSDADVAGAEVGMIGVSVHGGGTMITGVEDATGDEGLSGALLMGMLE